MQVEAEIAAITAVESGLLNPLHEVVDWQKRDRLVEAMAERGWDGPPLAADGENALTGVHRISAVAFLRNQHGVAVSIPRVEVEELCATFGASWKALLERHRDADDGCDYWYAAVQDLPAILPAEVSEYLGLDAC